MESSKPHNKPTITVSKLKHAIKSDLITPAYQPLVDLKSEAIVGFEVLARWHDSECGSVTPSEFIPIAEKNCLIDYLSYSMFRKACTEARNWPGEFILAFNLSPQQFSLSGQSSKIIEIIKATGFPLSRIHIEITEGALLSNEVAVHKTISDFKTAGMGIALDDFGTGFASLTQLHSFEFDKLKIDMSFIRNITTDSSSRKIVSSVIGLGQSLGMTIVAEGVETKAQASLLRRLGCDVGQGWLFGKPLSAELTKELIKYHPQQTLIHKQPSAPSFHRIHQLETLYEAAPIGLCLLDTELAYRSVNSRFAEMVGLTPSQMIGNKVSSFLPPEKADVIVTRLKDVLSGETIVRDSYQPHLTEKRLFLISKRVDDDDGTPVGISVAAIDVTAQRNVECLLSKTEELARWTTLISTNIPWSSKADGMIDFIGATPDDTKNTVKERFDYWVSRIKSDDYPRVYEKWFELQKLGQPFEIFFRMNIRGKDFQWVISRARPHFDDNGNIDKWYGVISEVPTSEQLLVSLEAILQLTNE